MGLDGFSVGSSVSHFRFLELRVVLVLVLAGFGDGLRIMSLSFGFIKVLCTMSCRLLLVSEVKLVMHSLFYWTLPMC